MTRTCQIDIPAESAGGHPYSHTTEILPQFSSESTQFFFSFFYFSVDLNPKDDIIKRGKESLYRNLAGGFCLRCFNYSRLSGDCKRKYK